MQGFTFAARDKKNRQQICVAYIILKKRLRYTCFTVSFGKFLRASRANFHRAIPATGSSQSIEELLSKLNSDQTELSKLNSDQTELAVCRCFSK